MRPAIVGAALQEIGQDHEVLGAMFDILETQKVVSGNARITLIPPRSELLAQLLAARTPASTVPSMPHA